MGGLKHGERLGGVRCVSGALGQALDGRGTVIQNARRCRRPRLRVGGVVRSIRAGIPRREEGVEAHALAASSKAAGVVVPRRLRTSRSTICSGQTVERKSPTDRANRSPTNE